MAKKQWKRKRPKKGKKLEGGGGGGGGGSKREGDRERTREDRGERENRKDWRERESAVNGVMAKVE